MLEGSEEGQRRRRWNTREEAEQKSARDCRRQGRPYLIGTLVGAFVAVAGGIAAVNLEENKEYAALAAGVGAAAAGLAGRRVYRHYSEAWAHKNGEFSDRYYGF